MKKGDLTMKAIGLAVAGVLAGSRLLSALPKNESKAGGKNGTRARTPRTRRPLPPTSTSARA